MSVCISFFIKYSNKSFFVTAKHVLIDPKTNKQRPLKFMSIYLNPNNHKELGWEFTFSDKTLLLSAFSQTEFADIVAFQINTIGKSINFVNIKDTFRLKDTLSKKPVYIVGYPHDSLKIVKTKIKKWQGRSSEFYTETPSSFGASGSPVFIISSKNRVIFMGVYTGRNPATNNGSVVKAGLLTNLLNIMKDSF